MPMVSETTLERFPWMWRPASFVIVVVRECRLDPLSAGDGSVGLDVGPVAARPQHAAVVARDRKVDDAASDASALGVFTVAVLRVRRDTDGECLLVGNRIDVTEAIRKAHVGTAWVVLVVSAAATFACQHAL